jgi:uncharacterized protein YbjT (DUF2867 family)
MPKTILVTGATGNQGKDTVLRVEYPSIPASRCNIDPGGSVARFLLQYPNEYKVRALTRSPDSDGARKLAELGADVVQGDLTDASTLEVAFEGCWGAFVVTNFYDAVSDSH